MFLMCCLKKTVGRGLLKMTNTSNTNLIIRFGKPVLVVSYAVIKWITTFLLIILITNIILSVILFYSAIKIQSHIGYYIDMISDGDGHVLPSLQAVPVLFCLITNSGMVFLLYKSFSDKKQPNINRIMYMIILINIILITIIFIIIIIVIVHAYSEHKSLHDGIVVAMNNYSINPIYKSQIDRLQIEFQCCGSQNYDDWYSIKWYDISLNKGVGSSDLIDGNTPFSCCSIKSIYPCIHHRIEMTGTTYLYTPEYNLSISTHGCYQIIRKRKQKVGWGIVGNLLLYVCIQILTVVMFRFVQTAHFERSVFNGDTRVYTIWIFGCYTGKIKSDHEGPPELPPIPRELTQ